MRMHKKIINELKCEVWVDHELVATFYGEFGSELADFLIRCSQLAIQTLT